MHPTDLSSLLLHFARTRWSLRFTTRTQLLRWQSRQLRRFLDRTLRRAPLYRDMESVEYDRLPIMDKSKMMAQFDHLNTAGVTLSRALETALAAEQSRDFSPLLDRDISVGLSSGTSGQRGVFLVSRRERAMWAGVMFARVLTEELIKIILWRPMPLRVAFFLRANNNLYRTLSGRRVQFKFYDLFNSPQAHLPTLNQQQPEVLAAPARTLRWLAQKRLVGELSVSPSLIISMAEVLEKTDKQCIQAAFGVPVREIYQCTEGFLGYTCEQGTLHLNEEFVHVEPHWVDASRTRFHPIVTDFTRTTQLVVRYRLDDILRVRSKACPCGRVTTALEAVEGRVDEVLWMPDLGRHALVPVFPDTLRRLMMLAWPDCGDYRIEQHGVEWQVSCNGTGSISALMRAVHGLCAGSGIVTPTITLATYISVPLREKGRRIYCAKPASLGVAA